MELLLEERMVIEAIDAKAKSVEEISLSTGLGESVVDNILKEFLEKNIVKLKDQDFSLDRITRPSWIKELSSSQGVKLELKELLCACVDLMNNKKTINLRKVYLTEFEEKLLNIELKKVDQLLEGIASRKREKSNIKDMKLVYWGHANYGEVL